MGFPTDKCKTYIDATGGEYEYLPTSEPSDPDDCAGEFETIGKRIGALVDDKNKAYGDSFGQSHRVLEVLYPHGILPHQYKDLLYVVRVLDKLFRIATAPGAFKENPKEDIAGYSILGCKGEKQNG